MVGLATLAAAGTLIRHQRSAHWHCWCCWDPARPRPPSRLSRVPWADGHAQATRAVRTNHTLARVGRRDADLHRRHRSRRRMLRITLALPLLCAIWGATLWFATIADDTPYGPDARAALTLKIVAMVAASAVALRTMAPRARWLDRSHRTVALLAFAYVLPHQWTLLAAPGDDAWLAAQQRWSALLALALLTLAWASGDPLAPYSSRAMTVTTAPEVAAAAGPRSARCARPRRAAACSCTRPRARRCLLVLRSHRLRPAGRTHGRHRAR
jgi:hypothetical protein